MDDASAQTQVMHPSKTSSYLSKYECARVLGLRILQLQEGDGVADPLKTAITELLERRNPTVVRRYLPNGTHEDVSVSALKQDRYMLAHQLNPTPP